MVADTDAIRALEAERDAALARVEEMEIQRGDACPDTARAIAARCAADLGLDATAEDRIHTAVYGYGLALELDALAKAEEAEAQRDALRAMLLNVCATSSRELRGIRVETAAVLMDTAAAAAARDARLRAEERERCKDACEAVEPDDGDEAPAFYVGHAGAVEDCVSAIEALGDE